MRSCFLQMSWFFFLLFQGIEIGTELVAWGLTKGAEVGSHLMHKVVLCVSSHFFTHAAVYKAREQAQLHFASEKFFGVVRRHALLIKKTAAPEIVVAQHYLCFPGAQLGF